MMLIINGHLDDAGHEDVGHPERPERLRAVLRGINELHLDGDLLAVAPYSASRAELARVHDATYLDELGAYCYEGGGDLDADTYATYDSWSIAQFAAGAGLAVIKELQIRDDGVGFVAVRPPGHHASRDRAMGFCLLNNIAVAAAELTSQGERVLIVDWDVHHGNGTQSIFWDDPNVMYVSTHQWPFYPGSGAPYEIGGLDALGTTVNLPVPAGATGDVVRQALLDTATPAIEEFAPTWVLVSAGFDAHRSDPMADLALSNGDFAELAILTASFAPRPGRLALFLEGGYELGALQSSVTSSLGALLGADFASERPTHGGPGSDAVANAKEARFAALRIARDTGL
jgi:acetoin utilization deacetylase AcuC-like enzyme